MSAPAGPAPFQRRRQLSLRLAAILAIVASMLIVLPDQALACSCVARSPYEILDDADAAFVGTLVSRPDVSGPEVHTGMEAEYVFRVERAVKGDLPEMIEVRSALDGAACGFEVAVGQRIGVGLRNVDGHWAAGLCDQVDADALLAAAGPLPAPESGEIVALAGMVTPAGRTVALNAAGEILAHGAGQGETAGFALCPGSRTVIEHAWVRSEEGATEASILSARDLAGFHVTHEIAGPQVPSLVSDIACMDTAGDEVLLLAPGEVMRVSGSKIEQVAGLEAQAGCPGSGQFNAAASAVYFIGGAGCRGLYRHDLASGEAREIARVPDDSGIDALVGMALSPDERYLAVEAHPGPQPLTFRLLLFDLSAEPAGFIEAAFGGPFEPHTFLWLANDRFLLTGTTESLDEALILNPQLETAGAINGIWGGSGGVLGDTVYVLEPFGRLLSAPVAGGPARMLQTFADPTVHELVVLPSAVRFDPAATLPDNLAAAVETAPGDSATGTERIESTTPGRLVAGGIVVLLAGVVGLLLARSLRQRRRVAA